MDVPWTLTIRSVAGLHPQTRGNWKRYQRRDGYLVVIRRSGSNIEVFVKFQRDNDCVFWRHRGIITSHATHSQRCFSVRRYPAILNAIRE